MQVQPALFLLMDRSVLSPRIDLTQRAAANWEKQRIKCKSNLQMSLPRLEACERASKGRVPLVQRRAAHVFFDAQGRFVAERRSHWCNCAPRTGQIYEFLGFSRSLEHLKRSTFMTTRASKAIVCALCRDFSATRARECSPRIVEKTGKMCLSTQMYSSLSNYSISQKQLSYCFDSSCQKILGVKNIILP